MSFCLPAEQSQKFLQSLKDGTIDPDKLIDMSSAERRTFFEDIVGKDDARDVNAMFESKLLLKDQKRGLVSWAKKVSGISEPVRRDLIARIEKLDRVLTPKDEKSFLEDLASQRLGTEVSFDEAKTIADLSHKLSDSKAGITASEEGRLTYGANKVALQNYVNELKVANDHTSFKDIAAGVARSPVRSAVDATAKVAGIAKGIKASLDDSAIFRQGWRTLFTHPATWGKNAADSFANIAKQLGKTASNNDVLNGIKADIYSRPNAVDGTYQKMKLDIGSDEEAYPTSLPEKLPLFGRLYKASEVAYTGFLYNMRADIADRYVAIARQNGVDLTDPLELRSIGRLVNSLTGRGDLGSLEKVGKQVNTIFFSPKMLKSQLDFLTVHATDEMSGFARKNAALNLLKVVTGIAAILGVAKALDPKSVETDPRSSDFGKIRVGDTRFDVSGGMSSLVVLASRLLTLSTKSSTSGRVTKLDSGKYGAQTGSDVFVNFFENKLSPAASVVKDLMNQKDFNGNKPTIQGEASNLLVPLPITNAQELFSDPHAANPLIGMIADALGIATNTYAPPKKK